MGGALRWPRGGDRPPQSQGGRGEKRSTVHPGLPVLPRPLPSSVTGLRGSEGCLVGSGCHVAMFPSGCRKQASHAEPLLRDQPHTSHRRCLPPGAEPCPTPPPQGPCGPPGSLFPADLLVTTSISVIPSSGPA